MKGAIQGMDQKSERSRVPELRLKECADTEAGRRPNIWVKGNGCWLSVTRMTRQL